MLTVNRSSFRYEVKVTTPHFQIATMAECRYRDSFHLNEEKPLPRYPALWRQKKSRYLISPLRPAALMGTWTSRIGTLCPIIHFQDDGKIIVLVDMIFYWRNTLRQNLTCVGIGEDVPTWFDLLDAVHSVQANYSKIEVGSSSPHSKDMAPICISSKF